MNAPTGVSTKRPTEPPTAPPTAQERLARSRTNITQWLGDDTAARSAAERGGGPGLAHWLKGLSKNPLAALTIDALADRWAQHPLHTSAQLAEAAATDTIAPLVRRHPALVLGSAAVAGALLVRARPWRWLLRPALLAGVASQVAAQLLKQLNARPAPGQARRAP